MPAPASARCAHDAPLPTQPLAVTARGPVELLRDYAQLTKIRVTTLVVVTAWCGFFFGEHKSGLPVLTIKLLWALAGIGMVSAGTACMNEIIERKSDALMRRTALRPLVTDSMSLGHAIAVWAAAHHCGRSSAGRQAQSADRRAQPADRRLLPAAVHAAEEDQPAVYLRWRFPGAMPGVLGWTAARGQLEYEALRAVCHRLLLAVPPLPLHRPALSR